MLRAFSYIVLAVVALHSMAEQKMTKHKETDTDIATVLMRSTFQIEGANGTTGTGFLVGRPVPDFEGKSRVAMVLVTAAHVLEGIKADTMMVHLREKSGTGFTSKPFKYAIANNGMPSWTRHSKEDVGVMYFPVPAGVSFGFIPLEFLATDQELEQIEIRPSDYLFTLGFPHGIAFGQGRFPILRSGAIASYPILPTVETRAILFDFEVYPGNSGGPVFLRSENRFYGGKPNLGYVQLVFGLVTAQVNHTSLVQSGGQAHSVVKPLGVGVVIHSSMIREAINLLPEPPVPAKEVIE